MRQLRCRAAVGFTLPELLAVLAIIAVLLAVGLPAYRHAMLQGRRGDAISLLLDVATRQEQHMLYRGGYATDLRRLGYASAQPLSAAGHYRLRAEACGDEAPAVCYRLIATPVPGGSQAGDLQCASFALDSLGRRSATGTAAARCW